MSALFAHMVIQQSNMAMLLLGKVPHPQTGQTMRDIEAAKLFIDQLEMIEAKTTGNLSKEEEQVLKQTLMALRLAFVETVASPTPPAPSSRSDSARPTETTPPPPENKPPPAPENVEDGRKKFTKKY